MKTNFIQILKTDLGLSEEDISEAQKIKQAKGGRLGEILVQKKIITEEQMLEALSCLYDIPFLKKLSFENMATEYTKLVPIQFLKKYIFLN